MGPRARVPLHRYVYIAYVQAPGDKAVGYNVYAQQTIGRVIGHWPYTAVDKTQRHRCTICQRKASPPSLSAAARQQQLRTSTKVMATEVDYYDT
jgi:hypothetical protein